MKGVDHATSDSFLTVFFVFTLFRKKTFPSLEAFPQFPSMIPHFAAFEERAQQKETATPRVSVAVGLIPTQKRILQHWCLFFFYRKWRSNILNPMYNLLDVSCAMKMRHSELSPRAPHVGNDAIFPQFPPEPRTPPGNEKRLSPCQCDSPTGRWRRTDPR